MYASAIETTLRRERVAILGALFKLARDLDLAEEALQEASLRALARWPEEGLPDRPGAWLTTVGRNWMIDQLRARGRQAAALDRASQVVESIDPGVGGSSGRDSQLALIFACCAVDFPRRTRVTLALKTLLGLSTREIARAYLEKEGTTAQRITRARRQLRSEPDAPLPEGAERSQAIDAFLETLYLLFNEGYLAAEGEQLLRDRLAHEALSLSITSCDLLPFHAETHALAALFHFHLGRAPARSDAQGDLVPLEEQDRSQWDRARFQTGESLLERSISLMVSGGAASGPFQVQAAIAALHARAPRPADTDWLQIAALYRRLHQLTPTPVVELNAAIALAMSGDLRGGIAWLNALEKRQVLAQYHLLPAAKADLLRRAGKLVQARRYYVKARRLATNERERRFLTRRITELDELDELDEPGSQP